MDKQLRLDSNIEYLSNTNVPNADKDVEDFDRDMAHKRAVRDFREESWFFWVRIIALITVSALGICIVGAYSLHLILPACWHWLTAEQLSSLKDLTATIVSGALIAQTTTYFLSKKK